MNVCVYVTNYFDNPLPSLKRLYLYNLYFSGSIPVQYASFSNLEVLRTRNNPFITDCYDPILNKLCLQLTSNLNSDISDGTDLDADWVDFCSCGAGMCNCGDVNLWLGGTGNWDDSTKWSLGHVPLACEAVEILGSNDVVTMPGAYSSVIYLLHVDNGAFLDVPLTSKLTVLSDVLAPSWDDCSQN